FYRTSPRSTSFFFFTHTPPTALYTLSLHDALPIYHDRLSRDQRRPDRPPVQHRADLACRGAARGAGRRADARAHRRVHAADRDRSEEHTSELQSRFDLVCRLLLEKKK